MARLELLAVALLSSQFIVVSAYVRGLAVLPHGDFAADPYLLPNGSAAQTTALSINAACTTLGTALSTDPANVVIISPHGIALSKDFAVYLSSNASGYAALGGDLHNSSAPITNLPMAFGLDTATSEGIAAVLTELGAGTGVLPWADSEPVPLRWGEVVPLSFMSALVNGSSSSRTTVIVPPLTRYNFSVATVPQLLSVGRAIGQLLQRSNQQYYVVVSSDLSHVHSNPYVEPYGANDTAADAFDGAVWDWMSTGNRTKLLQDAASVAPWAMSCGIAGMVVGQGVLDTAGSRWSPHGLAHGAPTYYGMGVAVWLPADAAVKEPVSQAISQSFQRLQRSAR